MPTILKFNHFLITQEPKEELIKFLEKMQKNYVINPKYTRNHNGNPQRNILCLFSIPHFMVNIHEFSLE